VEWLVPQIFFVEYRSKEKAGFPNVPGYPLSLDLKYIIAQAQAVSTCSV
jgi:hypothetical protein